MKRFEIGDVVRFKIGSEIGTVTQTFERSSTAAPQQLEQFKIIIRFKGFTTSVVGDVAMNDVVLVRESSAKGDIANFLRRDAE